MSVLPDDQRQVDSSMKDDSFLDSFVERLRDERERWSPIQPRFTILFLGYKPNSCWICDQSSFWGTRVARECFLAAISFI